MVPLERHLDNETFRTSTEEVYADCIDPLLLLEIRHILGSILKTQSRSLLYP